ncbi:MULTISPECIES: TonB-dependent receptor [unclassified Caulobacter]|uniref:TonB-dependent receptor n=1 Tax=unclassified Caulobacter TaxID=2648921 RepID=UPI0006FFC44B|nr:MULTISPECIES: TonB-dependent receptor [unclassified Caulobacter]KQV58354.1 TonB-dependent receptor [Caulobacter sp. Root342]KQV69139.1 TonB-dependent receptor [Caulobacter sp. Root343]
MKNHLMLGAAAGALLIMTAGHALAADAAPAPAPAAAPADNAPEVGSEVDAVVIIGQGQSRQVQTVKDDAIGLEAAGTSALKAIDKLPGVTFQSADAFGAYEWSTRISIRGFNQNQLGFTLDGVPLGDMSYGNHNGLHISRAVASENIGRVELAQGAGALGTASTSNLGGTLQFFSRDPQQTMGGEIDVTGGSDNMHRVFGRFETGAIEQLGGLRGYISIADQKTDKWKGGGDQKQRQYDAKVVMPLGERGDLTGFYHRSERREQDYQDLSFEMIKRLGRDWDNTQPNWGLAVAAARAYQTGTALPAPFATVDDAYYAGAGVRDDDLYGAALKLDVTEHVTFNATAYEHKNKGQGLWYTPYLASPGFGTAGSAAAPLSIRTTEYDIDRGGLIADLAVELGSHRFSGGFWHEINHFNQARRFYAETAAAPSRDPLDFQENPFFTQWQYAFETKTTTGHLEDEWTISDAFKVNFGFKAIKVTNSVKTVVGNPLAGQIESKDNFLPQAGFVWKLSPDIEAFGGYTENLGAFVSAATAGPFGSQSQAVVDYVAKTLKPESSKTFELGARYRNERFQGVAAVYHVAFDNRLLAANTAAPILGLPAVLSNVGSVETKGVELAGTYRLTDAWSLYGAYTYNDSKYEDDVVDGAGKVTVRTKGKTVVNTPKNIFKGELSFEQAGFFGKLGVAYTDKRYYTYENVGGQAPSTTIADLTLGYRFGDEGWGKGLQIQANVTNLTDKDYISTIGSGGFVNSDPTGTAQTVLTAPPRQFYVSVKKTF